MGARFFVPLHSFLKSYRFEGGKAEKRKVDKKLF